MQTKSEVIQELAEAFDRCGYVRRQNPDRVSSDGQAIYKKGDEVRFSVRSEDELAHLRELLIAAGFKPGRPYSQGYRFRQPVYGRKQVRTFLELIGYSAGLVSN